MTAQTQVVATRSRPSRPLLRVTRMGLPLIFGLLVGAVATWSSLQLPSPIGPIVLATTPIAILGFTFGFRDTRWAVALFAATLPVGLTILPGGIQVVQVSAVLVIFSVAAGRVWGGRSPLLMPAPVVALLLLVAWSVLTSPVAIDLGLALRWNASLLTAALLVATVVTATDSSISRLRHLTWFLFAGSVATCATALPESAQQRSFGAAVVEGRAQGVFSQPNELGLFAGITLVLALALLVGPRNIYWPRLEGFALGLGGLVALAALGLSLSRGAWLGTLLALLVAILFVQPARRLVLLVGTWATTATVFLILTQSLPSQVQTIWARAGLITDRSANPYDERPAIWQEGLRQVREHPWTGVGAANFTDASARSSSEVIAAVGPSHAHNVLLNFTAEGGLPVLVALLVATALTGIGVVRSGSQKGWSQRERALLLVVGCAPLVVLGQGILDAPLRNPMTLLHTAAIVGLAIGVGKVRTRSEEPRSPQAADLTRVDPLSCLSTGHSTSDIAPDDGPDERNTR